MVARETPAEKRRAILRPITYRAEEAALVLGVSIDYFRDHIAPELRRYRDGRLALYPATELETWAERNASLPLDGQA